MMARPGHQCEEHRRGAQERDAQDAVEIVHRRASVAPSANALVKVRSRGDEGDQLPSRAANRPERESRPGRPRLSAVWRTANTTLLGRLMVKSAIRSRQTVDCFSHPAPALLLATRWSSVLPLQRDSGGPVHLRSRRHRRHPRGGGGAGARGARRRVTGIAGFCFLPIPIRARSGSEGARCDLPGRAAIRASPGIRGGVSSALAPGPVPLARRHEESE